VPVSEIGGEPRSHDQAQRVVGKADLDGPVELMCVAASVPLECQGRRSVRDSRLDQLLPLSLTLGGALIVDRSQFGAPVATFASAAPEVEDLPEQCVAGLRVITVLQHDIPSIEPV
jgi:hypothetical protein